MKQGDRFESAWFSLSEDNNFTYIDILLLSVLSTDRDSYKMIKAEAKSVIFYYTTRQIVHTHLNKVKICYRTEWTTFVKSLANIGLCFLGLVVRLLFLYTFLYRLFKQMIIWLVGSVHNHLPSAPVDHLRDSQWVIRFELKISRWKNTTKNCRKRED